MRASAMRIWYIVPCKGRLSFLRQSLPRVLAQTKGVCCLVDYDCPEHCGRWAAETFPGCIESGRLVVERLEGRPLFNKAAAHNAGARRAIEAGADQLVFLDADTLLAPDFVTWIGPALNPHQFWIAARREDGCDVRDLYGFLITPRAAYEAIGGHDEQFEGWGIEDFDIRLQLWLRTTLIVGEVPLSLLSALPHADDIRTQYYQEKNRQRSDRDNYERMIQKMNRQNSGAIPVDWQWLARRMECRNPLRGELAPAIDMVPAEELRAAHARIQELERALEALRAPGR